MFLLKVEIIFQNDDEYLSLKSVKTYVNKKLKSCFKDSRSRLQMLMIVDKMHFLSIKCIIKFYACIVNSGFTVTEKPETFRNLATDNKQ